MYGMVNKAMEGLIVATHGEDTWLKIRNLAGVEDEVFISNHAYPDEVTYALVGAACKTLNQEAETFLFSFGEWWVLQTAMQDYGPLMRANGKTLKEFLLNLPNFHTRVAMIFPRLHPPLFRCSDVREDSLLLHYLSHRQGLSSFVRGIISGMATMFGTTAEVVHLEQKEEGADHDVFSVRWPAGGTPSAAAPVVS